MLKSNALYIYRYLSIPAVSDDLPGAGSNRSDSREFYDFQIGSDLVLVASAAASYHLTGKDAPPSNFTLLAVLRLNCYGMLVGTITSSDVFSLNYNSSQILT